MNIRELSSNIYLKHEVANDLIMNSYTCFTDNSGNEFCLVSGEDEDTVSTNRESLNELFGSANCTLGTNNKYSCENDELPIEAGIEETEGAV